MQLKHIYKIQGQIEVLTGLHIGGNKDNIEIGGMDQPIIKIPHAGAPYIPGSSLKGKMRSMLETVYFANFIEQTGLPCEDFNPPENSVISRIFGSSNNKKPTELGSTRIIVRDAMLSEKFRNQFNKGNLVMEEKYENTIHRIKGTAEHPRPLERVPAGVVFDFAISLKQMDADSQNMIEWIWRGLKLIELDGLGGNISRGSGQVRFINVTKDGESQTEILNEIGTKLWEKVS